MPLPTGQSEDPEADTVTAIAALDLASRTRSTPAVVNPRTEIQVNK